MKFKSKDQPEKEYEEITGIIHYIVDCSITVIVNDYFLTIPTARIMEIKSKNIGTGYSGVHSMLQGGEATIKLKPIKETQSVVGKW